MYYEDGELRLDDGQTLHSRQRYVYEKSEGGFAVFFYDTQELFHLATFEAGEDGELRADASHLCKDDRYVTQYTIRSDGSFEVRHLVNGPRKDYSIRTVYWRSLPK